MVRRLGIILATTVVALLVMTDGAWACRCMNRLINRCGHRRVAAASACSRPAVNRSRSLLLPAGGLPGGERRRPGRMGSRLLPLRQQSRRIAGSP